MPFPSHSNKKRSIMEDKEKEMPSLDDLLKQVEEMKATNEKLLKEKDDEIASLSKEVETLKKESVVKLLGISLSNQTKQEQDEDDSVEFRFE